MLKQKITIDKKIKLFRNSVRFFSLSFLILFSGTLSSFGQMITKGPYLAVPESEGTVVRWESDEKADFKINYAQNRSLGFFQKASFLAVKNNHYLYEARPDHLQAGRTYYYQVTGGTTATPVIEFKSLPAGNAPLRFAVLGDSRSNRSVFGRICEQLNKYDPDLILATGDLVAQGGAFDQWGKQYFALAAQVINHIPLLSTVGDHEADPVDGDEAALFSHYLWPHKNRRKLWFSFDAGNAHFVMLDYRHPDNWEMIDWFKNDLSACKTRWKFVFMHRPCYNLGGHRSFWGQKIWPELFRKYEIDIVFAGHSHIYERFYPVRPVSQPASRPVTYITTGGAGAPLYDTIRHPFLAFSKSAHHFLLVQIEKNRLTLQARTVSDSLLDEVSWSKNEAGVDESYSSLVKPQEELNIIRAFTGALSQKLERLPMKQLPAEYPVKLQSNAIGEDVDFEISLTDESAKYYRMETKRGKLLVGKTLLFPLKIFADKTMTITKWGELTPLLQLKARYSSKSWRGEIKGGRLAYRAW